MPVQYSTFGQRYSVTSIPPLDPGSGSVTSELPAAVPGPVVDPQGGYTVAVRALCEFTAKVGDLDLRFTPSPLRSKASQAIARSRRDEGRSTSPKWPSAVSIMN